MIKSDALNWLRVFRSVILLALIIAGHAMYLFIIPVYLSVMSSRFRYQQAPSRHHGAPVELPSPTIVVLWEHFPGGGGGLYWGPMMPAFQTALHLIPAEFLPRKNDIPFHYRIENSGDYIRWVNTTRINMIIIIS